MEKETSIAERLKIIMNHFGLNPHSFSKALGMSAPRMDNVLKEENRPNFEFLTKVIGWVNRQGAAKLNLNWLLIGEGEMWLPENAAHLTGIASSEFVELPMLDPRAAASFSENIYQELYELTTDKKYRVFRMDNHNYENAMVMPIEGYSMYPTYRPGTRVIVRLVPEGRWQYARGVHAISIKGNIFTIKRIVMNTNNMLTLKADNPNEPTQMDVQIADILCMFKVGEKVYEPAEE